MTQAEITSPIHASKETEKGEHKLNPEVGLAITFVLLTAALTALDLYVHSDGGTSNPLHRAQVAEISRFLASHIGNFSYSAVGAITAVFAKEIGLFIAQGKELGTKIVRNGYKWAIAAAIATQIAAEIFKGNTEFVGDVSMALLGIGLPIAGFELAMKQLRAKAHTEA